MFLKKQQFLYDSDVSDNNFVHITKNETVNLSPIKKRITQELSKKPLSNLTDLKTALKIDIKTLKKYLLELENEKVIMLYRYFMHPDVLGYQKLIVFLYLYNFSAERQILIESLLKEKHITSINLCFGNADIIMDFYTKNIKDVYSFLSDIVVRFPKMVKKYEIYPLNESISSV